LVLDISPSFGFHLLAQGLVVAKFFAILNFNNRRQDMRMLGILIGMMITLQATAETKILKVEKMHCEDCVAQVKAKLCVEATYSTCEVKILDEKKELGQVTLVTKGKDKVDLAKVTKIIEDEGYTIQK
jgi:copper chaperone CopZ